MFSLRGASWNLTQGVLQACDESMLNNFAYILTILIALWGRFTISTL